VRLRDPVAGGDRFDARREVARNLLVFVIGERGVQRYTGPDASLTP
jgi:hypothetical protein